MICSLDTFSNNRSVIKNGLPGFAYTSAEFHRLENRTLFSGNWVFAGFAHQLAQIGDLRPVTIGDQPIFMARNEEGEIAAFHNACRHRCLQLVDQPGNCGKLIRCPYHSWVYSLQGELRAAPWFGGREQKPPRDFSLQSNGLLPVRCRVWHDWIFVNTDGRAGDFEEFILPLKRQLGDLSPRQFKPAAILDLGVVHCNWKLLLENFIEPYHVQFVHKTTTSQPLTDHYTISDRHCLGSACDIEPGHAADTQTTLAVSSRYLTLFPNFVMGTYAPDQLGVHLNIPVSVDQTRQFRVIYLHRDSPASDDRIENLKKLWYNVHKEDHAMCERLQLGRKSPVADSGGWLSPHWEDSVYRFQQLVVEAIRADDANPDNQICQSHESTEHNKPRLSY